MNYYKGQISRRMEGAKEKIKLQKEEGKERGGKKEEREKDWEEGNILQYIHNHTN